MRNDAADGDNGQRTTAAKEEVRTKRCEKKVTYEG
jgi:hypothetical protein